ncbi:MAG: type II secretion system F family protein [Desulfobacterales bacterium]|nr:type II secretion system F family protein [Desulfobacterales bacterium]
MPNYAHKSINETGATVSGEIEADSREMAISILEARGYMPTQVNEKGGGGGSGFGLDRIKEMITPVKAPELIIFTKQFKTMLRAGVPMVKLLQILEKQAENLKIKRVTRMILDDISGGSSLHDAFVKHPGVFSPLYCGMVQAGEASGALPTVLDRLTYIINHENKIRSDIKAALQYPIIVVGFLAIAFFVLLTFVIPKFVNIFLSAGLSLPIPTKICLFLYQFLSDYWQLLLGGIFAAGTGLYLYLRTDQGRYVRDATLLRLPILGELFIKAAMSRFASIFAILQSSGVSVLEAMRILATTVGNAAISKEFQLIGEKLEEGRGIAAPLEKASFFTPIVVNMVAIGEESGKLDEMLMEISEHYDIEVEYSTKKLSDAIGPLLTIGLAVVVGFFALAIFLPMWDLIGIVK